MPPPAWLATRRQSAARRASSGVRAPQDLAHLAHGRVARRLAAQIGVLLRARDDLRVDARELLGEGEVGLVERVGARAVVQVQHAQHAAVREQRHAQRGFDVEPLAHDAEARAVGLAAQPQRAALLGDAAGDPLAEAHADLRPELGLDARRDAHAQLAALLVEQHQRAALGAGHASAISSTRVKSSSVSMVRSTDSTISWSDLEQLGLALAREGRCSPRAASP